MRVVFGSDEQTAVTGFIVEHLEARGHEVSTVAGGGEWPEVGRAVAEQVADGSAELGIVCCTTGTGVSIAANKVRGVRAALCTDSATAAGARRWNDANVLALSLRLTTPALAEEVLGAFLTTPVDADQQALVARIEGESGAPP